MDNSDEQEWCDQQRSIVVEYLAQQSVEHGEVGEWPAWHVQPHVAVWAVESVIRPGWIGWWAISGDLPTDYTSCRTDRHPRAALRDIAERWKEGASLMAEGKMPSDWSVGRLIDQTDLAPLLAARADLLLSFAGNDDLWAD